MWPSERASSSSSSSGSSSCTRMRSSSRRRPGLLIYLNPQLASSSSSFITSCGGTRSSSRRRPVPLIRPPLAPFRSNSSSRLPHLLILLSSSSSCCSCFYLPPSAPTFSLLLFIDCPPFPTNFSTRYSLFLLCFSSSYFFSSSFIFSSCSFSPPAVPPLLLFPPCFPAHPPPLIPLPLVSYTSVYFPTFHPLLLLVSFPVLLLPSSSFSCSCPS